MSDYTKLFASWIVYKLALKTGQYLFFFYFLFLALRFFFLDAVEIDGVSHYSITDDLLLTASALLGLVCALFKWRAEYLEIKNSRLAADEKERKKIEAKEAAAAKKEATRLAKLEKERGLLEKAKNELSTLSEDVEKSNQASQVRLTKKYQAIVKKVEQEQKQVKDLSERHPTIGKFLMTRGTDDLNSQVFKQLKKRLKTQ